MTDFSCKVALVTGAAAGMGLATARAFAEHRRVLRSRHRSVELRGSTEGVIGETSCIDPISHPRVHRF